MTDLGKPAQPDQPGDAIPPAAPPPPPYTGQPGFAAPPGYPGPHGYPGDPGFPGYPGYVYPPPPKPPTQPAMWAHLGALLTLFVGSSVCCIGFLLSWIAPVVIRSNEQNKQDPYIRHHAAQALNYAITQTIAAVLLIVFYASGIGGLIYHDEGGGPMALPIIAFVLLGLTALYALVGLIFAIIGTVKASNGQWWSYPKVYAIPFVNATPPEAY